MGMASDVLLGGLRTWPTVDRALYVECGRDCGFTADLTAGATITDLLAAGRHDCPRRGEVIAEVLASVEAPVPVGGDR